MVLGSFWKRFLDLLPKSPRYIGTIISIMYPGSFIVQIIGGGIVQASGEESYHISDRVFVEGKQIVGKAPTLQEEIIEV